jgi:SAM-dependent methyltransferase
VSKQEHWNAIYADRTPDGVSWYRPHLDRSVAYVESSGLSHEAAVIDIGGGASTFVDDLVDRGYSDVTVLDLSESALAVAQARLEGRASRVDWVCADVTDADLPRNAYDFWHDRAVFHFLCSRDDRLRYVEAVRGSLRPGGHVVIATFGPNGPEECSGLEVLHFTAESLDAELGDGFETIDTALEIHNTPWGAEQEFVYVHWRRTD